MPFDSIAEAREHLESRLATLRPEHLTVGTLLEIGREIRGEVTPDEAARDEVRMSFETFGRTSDRVGAELVWRWPHADDLDAAPERLRLRFDVAAGPRTREVEVRARDYPHAAAFVAAALQAAELDPAAPVSRLRLAIEHA